MRKGAKKLAWLVGISFILLLILLLQYRFAEIKYQQLRSEFTQIKIMADSKQLEERSNYKPNNAFIDRLYSSASIDEDIKSFYFIQLSNAGWKYEGERSLKRSAGVTNVKEFVFSKREYYAKLDLPYEGNPTQYWISLTWGLQ